MSSSCWFLLVALFSISHCPLPTGSCSCYFPTDHIQQFYCDANVVMKILVESEEILMREPNGVYRAATATEIASHLNYQGVMYRRYTYKTQRVYKGSAPASNYAYTRYHGNLCGGRLSNGSNIVMVNGLGSIGGQEVLSFGLCDFVRTWQQLSKAVRVLLTMRAYRRSCKCQIWDCISRKCTDPLPNSPNTCFVPSLQERHCYQNTVCTSKKNKGCGWRTNVFKQLRSTPGFENCI